MAQLKETMINGNLTVTDTIYYDQFSCNGTTIDSSEILDVDNDSTINRRFNCNW